MLLLKLVKSKQHRAGTLVFPSALLRKTLLLRRPLFPLLLPLQLCFHLFLKVLRAAKRELGDENFSQDQVNEEAWKIKRALTL